MAEQMKQCTSSEEQQSSPIFKTCRYSALDWLAIQVKESCNSTVHYLTVHMSPIIACVLCTIR